MQIINTPSPNFNARRDGKAPSMVVLHYTGMKTAEEALARLCDPTAEVSAHFVVKEDGRVHQLVDMDQRAWHAGVSYWAGESDINSASIGVEIVNPGHEFGYQAFPDMQMESVVSICELVANKYGVPRGRYLAHSDVAPERKQDPGELFDWGLLAREGYGILPDPNFNGEGVEDLTRLGYNHNVDFSDLVESFHRHFLPYKFAYNTQAVFDAESAQALASLLSQTESL